MLGVPEIVRGIKLGSAYLKFNWLVYGSCSLEMRESRERGFGWEPQPWWLRSRRGWSRVRYGRQSYQRNDQLWQQNESGFRRFNRDSGAARAVHSRRYQPSLSQRSEGQASFGQHTFHGKTSGFPRPEGGNFRQHQQRQQNRSRDQGRAH